MKEKNKMNFDSIIFTLNTAYSLFFEWDSLSSELQRAGRDLHNELLCDASKNGIDFSAYNEIELLDAGMNPKEFINISDGYYTTWGSSFQCGKISQHEIEQAAILYCALCDLKCDVESSFV